MTPVNQDFFNDSYLQKLRLFLDVISTESAPHQALDSPIILKEGCPNGKLVRRRRVSGCGTLLGSPAIARVDRRPSPAQQPDLAAQYPSGTKVLVKRAMGRRLMGLKNFRQRYFCLTTRSLTYAAHKGQRPLHEIPVDNIRTVELVDEAQFKKKNMFKLVQPDKDLYIQANNCVDQKAWVDILSKVCAHNQDKTDQFHPGQFRDNIWTCCRTPTKNAIGCAPVTADKLHAEIKLAADSDREMERDEYACKAVYLGDPDYEIQDTEVGYKTINSIVSAVISLEQEHRDHSRSLARGIRYGSRRASHPLKA
ncbi:ras GTPase-activating protein 3-like [Pollicipes pollicipes]|uniref:ras GTPase-activating protein 3-like n=1 Tax=Pollicipes pollicipes TaxID=41117 RepID=UPI001884D329|nr:ras GTPase-activating protein 3-like [Pollicipes pollicipes]